MAETCWSCRRHMGRSALRYWNAVPEQLILEMTQTARTHSCSAPCRMTRICDLLPDADCMTWVVTNMKHVEIVSNKDRKDSPESVWSMAKASVAALEVTTGESQSQSAVRSGASMPHKAELGPSLLVLRAECTAQLMIAEFLVPTSIASEQVEEELAVILKQKNENILSEVAHFETDKKLTSWHQRRRSWPFTLSDRENDAAVWELLLWPINGIVSQNDVFVCDLYRIKLRRRRCGLYNVGDWVKRGLLGADCLSKILCVANDSWIARNWTPLAQRDH